MRATVVSIKERVCSWREKYEEGQEEPSVFFQDRQKFLGETRLLLLWESKMEEIEVSTQAQFSQKESV